MLNPPLFDTDEFYPSKADITRDVFCAMLYGYEWINGKSNTSRGIFKDVGNNNTYYYEVEKCYENGWVSGEGNGYFNPGKIVTRQEIAVILYAKAKKAKEFKDIDDTSVLDKYEDRDSIAPWAERAVAWATENGYFAGENISENCISNRGFRSPAPKCAVYYCTITYTYK